MTGSMKRFYLRNTMNLFSYSTFYIIFCLPTLFSYFFSFDGSLIPLISSCVFLFATSSSIFILSTSIFKKKTLQLFFSVSFIFSIYLIELLQCISFYLQGESFNGRFFNHFSVSTIKLAWSAYPEIPIIFSLLFMLLIFLIYLCTNNHIFQRFRILYIVFAVLSASFLDYPVKLFIKSAYPESSKFSGTINVGLIEKFGLNPKALSSDLKKATPGKNLVLIYLESVEKVYTEFLTFPQLTPNIKRLMEEGITFNEFVQTQGTDCTISGIFASQCGTPLLLPSMMSANDIMSRGYFQDTACLSDILGQAGYYQVYMGGARKDFAGKSDFLLSHGYNEVKGFEELKPLLNHQDDYCTGWGLYDDSLFEFAAQEYIKLADSREPFNLTLLTLDTHPEGMPSHSCVPYAESNNSMLNAIHCTDQILMKFVETMSSHSAYENTIVVILTDHLTMRSTAMKYYPEGYERKLLFIILNTGERFQHDELTTHMDVAPTVLSALGVAHDGHFLYGRDRLKSDGKTTQIDYKNPKLIELTKHINSRYLSNNQSHSVFGHDVLVEVINSNEIRIGNKRIPLSYQSVPFSVDRLKEDLAIVIFLDANGRIMDYAIAYLNDLIPVFLEKMYTDDLFLILAPNKNLPLGLNRFVTQENAGLSVFFGRFDGPVVTLGSFDNLNKLKIPSRKTEHLMECIRESTIITSIKPLEWLLEGFKTKCTEKRAIPFYDGKPELIKIPCIKVGPSIYKASLKRRDVALFELEELTMLKETSENCCCAYFAFGHLFTPLSLDNGMIEIIKLTSIPNTKPLLLKSETIGTIDGSADNF